MFAVGPCWVLVRDCLALLFCIEFITRETKTIEFKDNSPDLYPWMKGNRSSTKSKRLWSCSRRNANHAVVSPL